MALGEFRFPWEMFDEYVDLKITLSTIPGYSEQESDLEKRAAIQDRLETLRKQISRRFENSYL